MRQKIRRVISVSTVLLLTACGGGFSTPGGEQSFVSGNGSVSFVVPAARVSAPEVSGTTLDGSNFTRKTNSILVVNVWASWCAPCRAEAPTLEQLSKSFAPSGVQFLGIVTRDNDDAARAFLRRFAISYPTMHDDNLIASFNSSLSPNAIPTTLVIDRKNRIAARLSGEVTVASLTEMINKVIGEGA
ncbi:MAG TPA: TlpA disulfide reductase family protein [Candidatus Nanopelagicaceae bacterium]|nr:TlpA disulfide reductase family protein [Candidatus Nanopelagicaceae bacterium]